MLSADTSHKASVNKCYLDDVVKCEGTGINIQMKLLTINHNDPLCRAFRGQCNLGYLHQRKQLLGSPETPSLGLQMYDFLYDVSLYTLRLHTDILTHSISQPPTPPPPPRRPSRTASKPNTCDSSIGGRKPK
jgi:hypothetical protein